MRNLSHQLIRYLRLGALLLVASFPAQLLATHLVGGDLTYRYIRETENTVTYELTLFVYRDCGPGTEPFDNPAFISIFDGLGRLRYALVNLRFTGEVVLDRPLNGPCFIDPGDVCVSRTSYSATVTIDKTPAGGYYHIIYERCCRNSTINNIVDPLETGQVFDVILSQQAIDRRNSSPSFSARAPQWPPVFICTNVDVDFDHSAYDVDGDSLVYELITPFAAATEQHPKPRPGTPFYDGPNEIDTVKWLGPTYSQDNMLGAEDPEDRLKIDAVTGRLTGVPDIIGQFVVGVNVKEYDRETGILLSNTHRDFQYNVRDCGNVASAFTSPMDECGLTVTFSNESVNADQYLWFFDYPDNLDFTSTEQFPTVTYPAAGTYQVQLIAIQSDICRDTVIEEVTVVENTIEIGFETNSIPCGENAVLLLSDQSVGLESPIVQWEWTVGNGDGTVQTSNEQNPSFVVPEAISDEITLTVTAANGCKRTLTVPFEIERTEDPSERLEELIESCTGEEIFLNPQGNPDDPFSYHWSPGNLVSDSTAVNPTFTGAESAMIAVLIESLDQNKVCSLTKTIEVVINDPPALPVESGEIFACEGDTITLSSGADATQDVSFEWAGPNDFFSSEATPVLNNVSLDQAGDYFVTVTDNNTQCASKATYTLSVAPRPVVSLTPVDPSSCTEANGSIIIGGLAAGETYSVTYSLDGGPAISEDLAADANGNITLQNLGIGQYEIVATNTAGCSSKAQQTSLENPRVVVSASNERPCEGEDVQLRSMVTGGSGDYAYAWTGPDGFTSTEAQPLLTGMMLSQSGTYTLVVTDVQTNCVSEEQSLQITVGPTLQISLTPVDPSTCTDNDGSIIVGGLVAGETYTIGYGLVGGTATTEDRTADADGNIVLENLGVGRYEIEVVNPFGCTSDPQMTSLENPRVVVSASSETPCEGEDVQLMSTVTGGSGEYSYAWTGPNGFSSTEAEPQIMDVTVAQGGAYTLVVTDNQTSCVSMEKSVELTVNPTPVITLTPVDPTICTENNGRIIIGGLTPDDTYTIRYSRDGGVSTTDDLTADPGGNITLENLGVGQYEIEATNAAGCSSGPQQTTLENPRVEVTASNEMPCEGEDLQLTSTVTGGSGDYAYAWTGPNGFTSTEAGPEIEDIAAAQSGTYTLVVTDNQTNCVSLEKSVEITVVPGPQITLTPVDPTICTENNGRIIIGGLTAGETYTVGYSQDGGAATSEDRTADTDGNITLPNLGVGQYEIEVTDSAGCASGPQQTTLENPRVEVSASDETPCEGEDVRLMSSVTGGSGDYSYAWTGPDGFTSTEAEPEITTIAAAQGGTYTLVVTDNQTNCVSMEKSVEITVNPNPEISLTPVDPTSCTDANGSIIIGGLTAGVTYTVGYSRDGGAATAVDLTADADGNITLENLSVGQYEIEATDAAGCASGPQQTTLENPRVEVSASNETPCEGEEVRLMSTVTGGSGDYSYSWTGPNGFTSTEAEPQIMNITAAQSGTYTLAVTDNQTDCVSMEKGVEITVVPGPQITLTPVDPASCTEANGSIIIGGLTAGETYTVSYSRDGGAAQSEELTADTNGNITLPNLGVGQYEIEVTDAAGCTSGPQQTSLENPRVEVSASNETPCVGEDIQLMSTVTGGSGDYTYAWTGPDGFASTEAEPEIMGIIAGGSGTYTLVVTDNQTNCVSAEKSIEITIVPGPQITLTPLDPTSCTESNGSIIIGGLTSGDNYTISYSRDGGAATTEDWTADVDGNITLENLGVGQYEIEATDSAGCTSGPQQTTLENPRVEVSASNETPCEGENVQLMSTVTGGSGDYSFNWTGPDGFTSSEAEPQITDITTAQGGTYSLVVTDNQTGCVSMEKNVEVTVNPTPEITLMPVDPTNCTEANGSIIIGGLTAGETYTVSVSQDGGAATSEDRTADAVGNITLENLGVGEYEIEATNAAGCSSGPQQTTLENPRVEVTASNETPCEGEDIQLMSTVTGGSGDYSYNWTGPNGFTSTEAEPQIMDITAAQGGTYTLVVTDNQTDCVSMEKSVEITIAPGPQITLTPVDPTSCTEANGSIIIGGLTAGETYTVSYSRDGGAATTEDLTADTDGNITLENLGVGQYEIEVTDSAGCASGPQQTTLENPRVEVSASNETPCEGENVQLMSTVMGGSGDYSYAWTGPNGFTSTEAEPQITGITAAQGGTYTLVVTDNQTDCVSMEKSVEITIAPGPEITLTPVDPTRCTEADGSIIIGGLMPGETYTVSYSQDGGAATTENLTADADGNITLENLGVGQYEVEVTDSAGCSSGPQQTSLESPRVEVSASDETPCEGDDVQLMSMVTGGSGDYSYFWVSLNGFTSTEPNPQLTEVTFSHSGPYTLVVTDNQTNCVSEEKTIEITVSPTPEITLTPMDPTSCTEANGTIVIGGLTADETYTVSVSQDGGAATSEDRTADADGNITLEDLGVGEYEIEVTNAAGCSSGPQRTTLENPRVEVSASNEAPCEGEDIQLTSTVTGGSGDYSYAWTGPNGFASTEAEPEIMGITAAQGGTYTLVVTDNQTDCASMEKSVEITIVPGPEITLMPMDPTSCTEANGSIIIGGLTPGETYTVDYSQDGGAVTSEDLTADADGNITLENLGVGRYEIEVTDSAGCSSGPQETTLESPRVEVSASNETPCEGEDVQLTSIVTGGSGDYSYAWTGPDGFTSTEAQPQLMSVTAAQGGTYTLVVTDNQTDCVSMEKSVELTVNPTPEITLTPMDPTSCAEANGSIVIGGLTPGETYTVSYDRDGGSLTREELAADADGNIILENLGVGQYEIEATNAAGCSSGPQQTTLENPRVEVSASNETPCEGENVQLTSTVTGGSGDYSYAWTGPDGFTSTEAEPQLMNMTAAQGGTYTLIVTDNQTDCVSMEKSVEVTVLPGPEITLTPVDPTDCTEANGRIVIGGLTAGEVYTVSYSLDGGAATSEERTADADGNITLENLGVGQYEIEVTDSAGCSSGPQQTTLENPRVEVSASATNLCEGENLQLFSTVTGGSGDYTYNWTGPDGFTSMEAQPVLNGVTTAQSGTYTLLVTDNQTNCVSLEKSVEVAVNLNLQITLTPVDPSTCTDNDGSIIIGGLTAGETYTVEYSLDGGDLITEERTADDDGNIILENLGVGQYEIEVTNASGCGSDPQQTSLENPRVEVSASDETPCEGDEVQLMSMVTSGSGDYSYAWTGPDGFTSTAAQPLLTGVTAAQGGIYTLIVTDIQTDCVSDEKSVEVTVNPLPVVVTSPAIDTVCSADPVELTAEVSGGTPDYSVRWYKAPRAVDDLPLDTQRVFSLTPEVGQMFYLAEVIDANGCAAADTSEINYFPIDATIDPAEAIFCDPVDEVTLTVTNNDPNQELTYEWMPDGAVITDPADGPVVVVDPAMADMFTVTVENQYGCQATLTSTVTVSDLADQLEISADPEKVAPGGETTITVTGCSDCSYAWSPNVGDTGPVVTVSPDETTTYTVTVFDENECDYELSITIMVIPCAEENFFVPTAFTPNGDNVNDVLCVRSLLEADPEAVEMTFIVYNRWGEKVFESNSLTDCWDGTYRGRDLAPDSFAWYLEVNCPGGGFTKKGNVFLLR